MDPDAPLDYALFQLSPKRTRCELIVSSNGRSEKIASGFIKPFIAHSKAVEEQAVTQPVIRLQVEQRRRGDGNNGCQWFNKGTLERFVRFVSTPEVLEMANTFEAEMSQLEGSRKIYSQGSGQSVSGTAAENEASAASAADITKKELLRAIDVRLTALKQDVSTACARAYSAGFDLDGVSELLQFANHFGANRLSEACTKFMSFCERRPDLIGYQHVQPAVSLQWKAFDDGNVRGSSGSDMSIDELEAELGGPSKKTQGSGTNSQIHRLSNSQPSVEDQTETQVEQQPKPTMQHSLEKQEEETDAASPIPAANSNQQSGGRGSRRLSVQDRINLFESKQKEQGLGSNSNTSVDAPRVVAGKGEHRRVPSNTSMEKLVLRRWSGASDMSIDLSNNDSGNYNDRKENESSAGTPTSANLESHSRVRAEEEVSGLKETSTSQAALSQSVNDTCSASTTTDNLSFSSSAPVTPSAQTRDYSKDNIDRISTIQSSSSMDEDFGVNQVHGSMGKLEQNGPSGAVEQIGHSHSHVAAESPGVVKQPNQVLAKRSGVVGSKSKNLSGSCSAFRELEEVTSSENELRTAGMQSKSRPRKAAEVVVVESEMPSSSFSMKTKAAESARPRTILERQSSITEQELNFQGGKNRIRNERNSAAMYSESKIKDSLQFSDPNKDAHLEQAKGTRQSKGNQELHDELQMKANELEKLFAAHKLRAQNDQTTSSRRGKATDMQVDHLPKAGESKPPMVLPDQLPVKKVLKESTASEVDANLLSEMVDVKEYNNSVQQNFGILSLEESRGKSYERYTKKRDAKLREEWNLQRGQKEAIMKALHDSLERSQAEMRAKYSSAAKVQDQTYASQGPKKMSSSFHSALKDRDQGIESLPGEEEMNSDYLSGDCSSRSTDSRKHFSSKVPSIPMTSVVPIPKSSVKTPNSGFANRRTTPENPLAQSVPNFSDIRKENTKPSTGISRGAARAQTKSFSRSKSITEETNTILKEDKSRRSQSMRKAAPSPGKPKNISSFNDGVFNWTASRISQDQSEGAFTCSMQKSGAPKPFVRKGDGVRSGVGVAEFQASIISNKFRNGEEPEGFLYHQDDSPDEAKEEEEYESIEENLRESDFPAESDSENPRLSNKFGNLDDPGSENGDVLHYEDVATITSSKFNAFAGTLPDFSGGVPLSWNSRLPHLFPYPNENSDSDAFVDSPTGSPAPWNAHAQDQMEADVARMRKKWGSAQMPVLGSNASQQSRKDVTKGFKKLLKFGRKSRGGDGVANDWVSASTASECDDDVEDARDFSVGPSDDLRKSRMGAAVPSYDGYLENEVFSEQGQSLRSSIPNAPTNLRLREDHITGSSLRAPRSFFSLTTFRSKGSDAKLR